MKTTKEIKQDEIDSIKNPNYTIDPELNKYVKYLFFQKK